LKTVFVVVFVDIVVNLVVFFLIVLVIVLIIVIVFIVAIVFVVVVVVARWEIPGSDYCRSGTLSNILMCPDIWRQCRANSL
jgi:hypothetical protein